MKSSSASSTSGNVWWVTRCPGFALTSLVSVVTRYSPFELIGAIENEFGRTFPLSLIYEAGTIEAMAEYLRGNPLPAEAQILLPFRDVTHEHPLFFVHAMSGSATIYADLAQGIHYSLVGVQAPGLLSSIPPDRRIEAMAARYVAAVRQRQPRGPYLLGGCSLGGTIAYEMVRQLEDAGETVLALIMIDTPTQPEARAEISLALVFATLIQELAEQLNLQTTLSLDTLATLENEQIVPSIRKEVGRLLSQVPQAEPGAIERMLTICEANWHALMHYVPKSIDTPIHFVHARDVDPHVPPSRAIEIARARGIGWEQLTAGGLTNFTSAGTHATMLLQPNVKQVARVISEILESVLETKDGRDPFQ